MILLFVLGFGTKLGSVSLSQSFGHLSPWELDLECDTSVFEGSLVSLPHIFCIFEFAKLSETCSGSGVMVVSISFFSTKSIPNEDLLSLEPLFYCFLILLILFR